jgi:cysteine-rich repeat protein
MRARLTFLLSLAAACGDDGVTSTDPTQDPSTSPAATSFLDPTTSGTPPTSTSEPATTTTSSDATSSSESTDPTTSSATTEATTGATTTTTSDSTGSTDDTSTGTSDTSTGGSCGDGRVDDGEGCDDGDANGPDQPCTPDCQPNVCGDGYAGPGEGCDDGNAVDDDECTNACQSPACGDGIVGPGEGCDLGASNSNTGSCTLACQPATCGDGLVWQAMEACDDADAVDDDECSNDCDLPTCSDGAKNGDETGVDCGGPCPVCEALLLLGGNATKSIGASFSGQTWTTSDIAAPAVDAPDVAVTATGAGVGVLRYTKIGDPKDQQLQYVTWKSGVWSAPQQVGGSTTRAAPTLSPAGPGAHAVFHGENYQLYYAAFDGAAWNPTAEAVGSFGPGPGAVATLAAGPLLVFHDGAANNQLTSRLRVAGWQVAQVADGFQTAFDRQPAVVALPGTTSALAVHAANAGGQLRASERSAGVWSAAAEISDAQTSAPPALAGLPGQGAVLAFRGTDGKLYVATYKAGGPWTAPAPPLNPNPTIHGAPAVAAGVGAASVELVYLDGATKTPRHTRLVGNAWTAPTTIANAALERVAIASGP